MSTTTERKAYASDSCDRDRRSPRRAVGDFDTKNGLIQAGVTLDAVFDADSLELVVL